MKEVYACFTVFTAATEPSLTIMDIYEIYIKYHLQAIKIVPSPLELLKC